MSDSRYQTLLNILDEIRDQAPNTEEFRRFHSKTPDDISFSRGQAFIHLFLLGIFGVDTFESRNSQICDGPGDGGLDAYYISESEKTVYLIQSKFKNASTSFRTDAMPFSEMVKMELGRILNGELQDTNGSPYNQKIQEFQAKLNQAAGQQILKHKVVFLANIKNISDFHIKRITDNLNYEIYDFERTYLEIVKPICSGTYYNPEKIIIELDVSEKSNPQLKQSITTTYGQCDVIAMFVPTKEIGRVMSKYKNALLRYNPRNYLGLSKNPVNKEIRRSIIETHYNDFALLNNGITILAEEGELTSYTGTKNVSLLTLKQPQIINGGQTAFTLSEIFESEPQQNNIFEDKEVLVRVVTMRQQDVGFNVNKFNFIQAISTSTNLQTHVKEADKSSNNPTLIDIQTELFRNYGYLLELKQGEFYTGQKKKYLSREYIIDRILLLRAIIAFSGQPRPARAHSEAKLFEKSFFDNIFTRQRISDLSKLSAEALFSYLTHQELVKVDKKEDKKSLKYGYGLRYGKYAIVYASALNINNSFRSDISNRSLQEINEYIGEIVPSVLQRWKHFEEWIQGHTNNANYFNSNSNLVDYDTYYKGKTLAENVKSYFGSEIH